MAENEVEPEGELERIPPQDWIPHPVSDYVDWMGKEGPLSRADLTDEQRAQLDAQAAEQDAEQAAEQDDEDAEQETEK